MRNTSALHLGFAGCGTSLWAVRRQFNLDSGQVADTLDALGTLLMATGQSCLPIQFESDPQTIVQQAQAWSLIPARTQLRTLERLMGFLSSPPPDRERGQGESYDQPMLPSEMGSWDGEEPLPSCLGMLTILSAYARLTGARFLVGSVQRLSAEPAVIGLEKLLGNVYGWTAIRLPGAFYHDGLPTRLLSTIDDARASMALMTTRRQFHGALVIELADGRWASIDPYMHNLSFFEPKTRPIGRLYGHLALEPTVAASVQGRGYWERLPALEQQLKEVYAIIDYLLGLPRDIPLMELSHRLHHLAQVHAGITMTSAEEMLQYSCSGPPYRQPPTMEGSRNLLANLSTNCFQYELRQRLLMVLLNVWVEQARSAAQKTRSSEPHHAMMLSSPARTLGVWTVINLRHRVESRVLAADLLEYSGSDVVLYNACLDQQAGNTTRAEDELIRRRVARMRQSPHRLVHPLLLEVLA
jgi:hypothetical protein